MTALMRRIGIGWAALLVIAPAGCKTAKEEAKSFKRCGQGTRCSRPNVCIRSGRSSEGICVYPCNQHADCPKPFRCTGAYKLRGKPGAYCRRPSVSEGGDCTRIQDGCKAGLRCFKNKCVRLCAKTADCSKPGHRCLNVVDETLRVGEKPKAGGKNLYLACLPAAQKHGQRCSASGPFCARGHVCYQQRCYKTCKDDKECAKGRICDGGFWRAKKGQAGAAHDRPPDIRYCRVAGAENALCDLRAGKTCQRGLACLGSRCRKLVRVKPGERCAETRGIFCPKGAACYADKCRQICKVNQSCPRSHGKPGRCQLRTVRNKQLGLCF